MKIEIKRIPEQGHALSFEVEAGTLPVLKEMMDAGEFFFSGPITIQVHVAPEPDLIKVKGALSCNVQLACSRCLAMYEMKLSRRFTVRFSHIIPSDLTADGESDIELSAEQMDLMFFDGETIDLGDVIQEQVVLALPFKPLCREACKGLCPGCGADLNSGPCGCEGDSADTPFAILKNKKWPAR